MLVDDALIAYLEELSCLALSDDEKKRIAADLEKILKAMEGLNALDTANAPERSHPFDNTAASRALRDDVPGASFDRELILKNAPAQNGQMFAAPKTVE
ncbi:MAG: Asp-tRNA(Asn)/Glu-tRNA(Gln) amidotransferase subunit GatC [Spirochaetes bacterium]|nr:Asp-tRNA(Asn)/Glu-tRNA(Gln) amidotransferase subunit GatC [Spirochaetota bacterium]